jgi:hypothetical protein
MAARASMADVTPAGREAVEDAARSAQGASSLVMPLFANTGFVPFLRNLLCSLDRLRVESWFVIALDNATCGLLGEQVGPQRCVHPYSSTADSSSGQVQSYGSFGFYWIAMQRPLWLRWLLERGHAVLNCDLDIVWLHDPRPHLSRGRLEQADMLFQTDSGHGLNGGFYVARPSSRTLGFFAAWLADLAAKAAARAGFEEQHSLNRALRTNGKALQLRWAGLNESRFPNGKLWWSRSYGSKAEAFIVHCNWVKSNKKGRLRRDNLWFLDEHDARCQPGFDPFEDGCDRQCVPVRYCAPGESCTPVRSCAELRGWHPRALEAANCSAATAAQLTAGLPLRRAAARHRGLSERAWDDSCRHR